MLNNKFISSILGLNKLKNKVPLFPLIILLFFSCSVEKKELRIKKKKWRSKNKGRKEREKTRNIKGKEIR